VLVVIKGGKGKKKITNILNLFHFYKFLNRIFTKYFFQTISNFQFLPFSFSFHIRGRNNIQYVTSSNRIKESLEKNNINHKNKETPTHHTGLFLSITSR